jgi:pyruvate formate lyase activating enzyme
MHEASFYNKLENLQVQCTLCPHECIIIEGKFGDCHARRNRNGILVSEVFGRLSAFNTDPIEKKPLYHFYPGSSIVSIGSTGCNMHCTFCQNHSISQCKFRKPPITYNKTPEEIEQSVLSTPNNTGIAFTYNEPTVNYEFVIDTARLVKMNDKKTVMISNGYIKRDPLHMLLEYTDAFNIDLKGFTEDFYKRYSKASLKPVLKTIKRIAKSGKHLELTNLVIPQINSDEDDFESMCKWIANETGKDTVLHLSRFFPRYELDQYPTPPEMLFELYDIARFHLNHVYIGNMATEIHSNTNCPNCNNLLVERTYYHIKIKGLNNTGNCKKCNTSVIKYI